MTKLNRFPIKRIYEVSHEILGRQVCSDNTYVVGGTHHAIDDSNNTPLPTTKKHKDTNHAHKHRPQFLVSGSLPNVISSTK